MSDSTNPPSDVCCTVVTDECDKDPAGCSNHGEDVHIHVHVHVHRHCCSAATAAVTKPVKLQVIKFGFTSVAIGNSSYPNLMAQVKEPANYGPNGTYNKIQSVDAIDAAADIVAPSITAAELKAKYDVLSVGLHNSSFTVAQADRLKEYAALGGVLLLACDNGAAVGMLNVLQRFGHTGTLAGVPVVGVYSGLSSTNGKLEQLFRQLFRRDNQGVCITCNDCNTTSPRQQGVGYFWCLCAFLLGRRHDGPSDRIQ